MRTVGDKGFIGTDYITTPVRKPQDRDLYIREHDYNNQVSPCELPWNALLPTSRRGGFSLLPTEDR
jgi:hypothetical protein